MTLLVFPHQLFDPHPGWKRNPDEVILIEDSLFFGDSKYPADFHKQKLWFHRATMKRYEGLLANKGFSTRYIEYQGPEFDLKTVLRKLFWKKVERPEVLYVADPHDFILEKRIRLGCDKLGIQLEFLESPMFLNSRSENCEYRAGRKRWFMADFYKHQRRKLDVLIDENGEPVGGKWSFDDANRKKVPKKLVNSIPEIPQLRRDEVDHAAVKYVEKKFENRPGSIDSLIYPTSHRSAKAWLEEFLKRRLELFGDYEDAVLEGESFLWHSVLTPMLNVGLLTPAQVLKATLKHSNSVDVPLNSLEGFVRQVIGWREFMRATYDDLGVPMRTTNHWQHSRPMPACFYDGTTGILPVDDTISRILETGYCHHIERLMVLGGFMFLCEIDPKQICRWFMEMFIDSYDWVMVPNVYAMSQHADGGLITTKPYFSGSSYVRKMSHYRTGPWCEIWDGLYWRWIWNHVDALARNPRWAMMCSMARKMDEEKRDRHIETAEKFLNSTFGT